MKIERVMAVCAGNICRSPMAEALLRAALPDLEVFSAGLTAMVGQPASRTTQEVLRERGIDASAHRAQQFAAWMADHCSLILVAELRHKQHVERQYPQTRGRVFRICEVLQQDVPDPYRQGRAQYEQSLALIDQGIGAWAEKIRAIGYLPKKA